MFSNELWNSTHSCYERLPLMKISSDVTTLVALFAIVSPITSIPVFLNLTGGATKEKRRVIALQTALVSALTLFVAYFVGDIILKLLNIQMDAFRIAGALVIGAIGWSHCHRHCNWELRPRNSSRCRCHHHPRIGVSNISTSSACRAD